MPIRLVFSNHIETLFDALQKEVYERWTDPLSSPTLIVPNRLVEKWFKWRWAESFEVVAGLSTTLLERWLWSLVAEPQHRVLHAEQLQIAILDVLREPLPPEAGMLAEYIADHPKDLSKRVQIAAKLAALFLEYQTNRPLILENGRVTQRGFGFDSEVFSSSIRDPERRAQARKYESWQEWLFTQARRRCPADHFTLPELWMQKWDTLNSLEKIHHLRARHRSPILFGTSGLSLFHRHCLMQLADTREWGSHLDISVFLLNPCAEFWEDVETPAEQRRRLRGRHYFHKSWAEISTASPGDLWRDQADHLLLQLWGQAGRDNIALWCQAVDYDLEFLRVNQTPRTLLQAIQQSLSDRAATVQWERSKLDESLRIIAAPGIKREVELIQERVLWLLATEPDLQLHEIGVLCHDPETYRLPFAEVFDSVDPHEAHYIPYGFSTHTLASTNLCKALQTFLELTENLWRRDQIFMWLRNPLVQRARGISADQEADWESWVNSLNIFRGWDQSEHSWTRAIRRLLLADLAEYPVLLGSSPAHQAEDWILPWSDLSSQEESSRHAFVQTLEDLRRDLNEFHAASAEWSVWAKRVHDFLAQWCRFDESEGAEQHAHSFISSQLEQLSLYHAPCSWREFSMVLKNRLEHNAPAYETHLTGKLMIYPLREARLLPWKHAFVIGLQSGSFPPPERDDLLDLRWWKPIPGDNSPRRAAQYAFLELLTCVRKSLTLSYVCLDLAKDTPILPGSTILELQQFLSNSNLELTIRKAALLAEEDPQTRVVLPHLLRLRQDIPESETSANVNISATANSSGLSFQVIQDFLSNPIYYTISHQLGIRSLENTDPAARSDLILSWDDLEYWQILNRWIKKLFSALFSQDCVPENPEISETISARCWLETCAEITAEGSSPEGILRAIAQDRFKGDIRAITDQFKDLICTFPGRALTSRYILPGIPELLEGHTPAIPCIGSPQDHPLFLHVSASRQSKHFKNFLYPYIISLWRSAHGYSQTQWLLIRRDACQNMTWIISPNTARQTLFNIREAMNEPEIALHMIPADMIKVVSGKLLFDEEEPDWSYFGIHVLGALRPQIAEAEALQKYLNRCFLIPEELKKENE